MKIFIMAVAVIVMFFAFIAFVGTYDNSYDPIKPVAGAFIFSLSLFIFLLVFMKKFNIKVTQKDLALIALMIFALMSILTKFWIFGAFIFTSSFIIYVLTNIKNWLKD